MHRCKERLGTAPRWFIERTRYTMGKGRVFLVNVCLSADNRDFFFFFPTSSFSLMFCLFCVCVCGNWRWVIIYLFKTYTTPVFAFFLALYFARWCECHHKYYMPCVWVCIQNAKTIQTFCAWALCIRKWKRESERKKYCSVRRIHEYSIYNMRYFMPIVHATKCEQKKNALNIKTPPLLRRHSEYVYNKKNNHMHAMFQFVLSHYTRTYTIFRLDGLWIASRTLK